MVKIILFTIPYALASSATDLDQKAAELLEKTDIVASTPHALEALVDPYPAGEDGEEKAMACKSIINVLQAQLQNEASAGWKLSCIPRLFKAADVTMAGTEQSGNGDTDGHDAAAAKASQKHAFPTMTVPSPINPGPKALFPELYFSLFADQDIEVCFSCPYSTNRSQANFSHSLYHPRQMWQARSCATPSSIPSASSTTTAMPPQSS